MELFKDLTNEKFGDLQVVSIIPSKFKRGTWLCKCVCGNNTIVPAYRLLIGKTKSCGCRRARTVAKTAYRHGLSQNIFFQVWTRIMSRCYNPKNNRYNSYGERGIKVCDDWKKSPQTFIDWAENSGYKEGLTLDRIDVNKGYEPGNCRWATTYEQSYNKQNTTLVEIDGIKYTADDIFKMCGMSKACFYRYSKRNISFKEAINSWKIHTGKI